MLRTWLVFIVVAAGTIGVGARPAAAADPVAPGAPNEAAAPPASPNPAPPAPTAAPASVSPLPSPSPPTSTGTSVSTSTSMTGEPAGSESSGGVPMVAASTQAVAAAKFGVGARFRVTSVPKWLLGLFLTESKPLTSYAAGLEFFRRSGNFDFVLGVGYQPLSPEDGNWLGKGQDASTQTDYVQFRGLGAYTIDAAFIMHTDFNEFVGMHYGGGIGIGITKGKLLRTSNFSSATSADPNGCRDAPGDPTRCYPVVCPRGPCTEAQLVATEGGTDSPETPSRRSDNHVPTVYPIVNLITGLDARFPTLPGFALKLDLGFFFPTFFVGLSAAYQV